MLGRRRNWPQLSHAEIVKRARILVIDDQEFPYLKLFRQDGYTMSKWSDIKDLSGVEAGNYDLLLLDLLGVGRKVTEDEGLGVLKHIRQARPAQLVVAYSNADWPVSYQPFFDMADAVLPKTADYLDFKRTVDDLLQRSFSLGFYLDRINAEAGETLAGARLQAKAEKAILRGNLEPFRRYLERYVDNQTTIDRVLQIAQVAVGLVDVWTN